MSIFSIDVEADGPAPGLFSMVSFGIVKVDESLDQVFYGKTRPITEQYKPAALAVSGFTRQEHEQFDDPKKVMREALTFIESHNKGRAIFLSDNPAFDYQFMNYYFVLCGLENPFGHTARRIGDFYAGTQLDWFASSKWKKLRQTKHTHNPVDDAKGNAQAFLAFTKEKKIKVPF